MSYSLHMSPNESWHIWRVCARLRVRVCVCVCVCCEDCFYYCSERNNVVVLFGTLKVQSFILECVLLVYMEGHKILSLRH